MSVTAADIQAFASEFAGTDTATIALYLVMAPEFVDVDRFGAQHDLAVRLWVCHQLTLNVEQAAGAAGPITSESVGPITRQYGNVSVLTAPADLSRTNYGRMLVALSRQYGGRLAS